MRFSVWLLLCGCAPDPYTSQTTQTSIVEPSETTPPAEDPDYDGPLDVETAVPPQPLTPEVALRSYTLGATGIAVIECLSRNAIFKGDAIAENIVTEYKIRPLEIISGTVPSEISVAGGAVNDATLMVSTAPHIKPGKSFALVLGDNNVVRTAGLVDNGSFFFQGEFLPLDTLRRASQETP